MLTIPPPGSDNEETGKIVKSGDRFVPSDEESKTPGRLGAQQKARKFVNKSGKVTGVLDASAGGISVSAIGAA